MLSELRSRHAVALAWIALWMSAPPVGRAKTLPTSAVASIAVTPSGAQLATGRSRRFAATASFQPGAGAPRVLSAVPLAAGGHHTCALLADGTVDCWGRNDLGQLGDGTEIDSPVPRAVTGLSTAIAITAGDNHTCALLGAGTVACWGDNFRGQLGDGTNGRAHAPVLVANLASAVAITAGREHTCALLADETARCWGLGFAGQLGDGTNMDSNTPVVVQGISGATALSAGGEHTCALLANGTLRCWGRNFFGQLGDGSNDEADTPVAVANLTSAVAISAGDEHTCAVLADGAARCWGQGSFGRLGNGAPGSSNVPVEVTGISTARTVAAGDQHSCVSLADGTLQCWGSNAAGQLGNGSLAGGIFSTPIDVVALDDAVAIAAGGEHACALSSAGVLRCWGANDDGQLGTGSRPGPEVCGIASACSPTPVLAAGVGVASVSSGGAHACALFTDGTMACWGDNSFGQLGDGTNSGALVPVAVSGITNATAVSVGGGHTCALLADGHVQCWGSNVAGQLGVGSTADSAVPTTVTGIATATAIAAGPFSSCALLGDGSVRCWGFNRSGELGNGSAIGPQTCNAEGVDFACSTSPVSVDGIVTAQAISVGGNHACVLLAGGALRCWGQNSRGQLGNGSQDECREGIPCSATSLPVGAITTATTVSAGGQHTCAALDDGTARCWGDNVAGQLGNPTTNAALGTPLVVTGITSAAAITAGFQHSCARLADDSLRCWGSNAVGQLGTGTTGADSSTPVAVSAIAPAASVSSGTHFSCAIAGDGTVRCWGFNPSGQLGNGTIVLASAPVSVSRIFDAIAALGWSSLAPAIAAISAEGIATGIVPGAAEIVASAPNFSVSGGTTFFVPEPRVGLGAAVALVTLARLAVRRASAVRALA